VAAPPSAEAEVPLELEPERAGGGEVDHVDAGAVEEIIGLPAALGGLLLETPAEASRARVEQRPSSGLGVLQLHEADIGEGPLAGVLGAEGDDVVPAAEHGERAGDATALVVARASGRREEVAGDEDDRPLVEDRSQCLQGLAERGARARGLGAQKLAEHAEEVPGPLARGQVEIDVVAEAHQAHAVVVAEGGVGEGGAGLGDEAVLGLRDRPEQARGGGVDEQDDGELALLDEPLDEGLAGSGGDVPVDVADIVARLVLADLGELDALAEEGGVVLAREQIVDAAPVRICRRRTSSMRSLVSMGGPGTGGSGTRHQTGRSGHRAMVENGAHDVVGRHALGLGLVAGDDAVTHDVGAIDLTSDGLT
jgi:hypothetical protein